MISDAVLEQGVVRGIVTNQQVADLKALARDMTALSTPEPEDDEKLRFVTGFSDIFVTLGLVLFTGALGYMVLHRGPLVALVVLAPTSWLLAEFFTRRRRMALPSIVLVALFAALVFMGVDMCLEHYGLYSENSGRFEQPGQYAWAALATLFLLGLHYLRFRVPITVAIGVAALIGLILAILFDVAPVFAEANVKFIILAAGLAAFVLAMRFDLSDPERITRRTDIAFWLHLLAAPMIVHPLIAQLGKGSDISTAAPAVLAVFLALGVVAVVIDRRAILVSGLVYAGYALASLIRSAGFTDYTVPATLLVLGAFVLLLSAGWRPVRSALLRLLPTHLAQRLPNPILSSS